jgi:hypothetical protein
MIALSTCSPPPQGMDETSITYTLKFVAEQGVNTRVIFPLPLDAGEVELGLTATDGGTVSFIDQTNEGRGAALDGRGTTVATFIGKHVKGFGSSTGLPDVTLSMQQPDGGPGDLYLRVNKGGSAIVHVEYEFTASRDCGNGCGGKRSWTFNDDVGITLQPVHMTYVEEKR